MLAFVILEVTICVINQMISLAVLYWIELNNFAIKLVVIKMVLVKLAGQPDIDAVEVAEEVMMRSRLYSDMKQCYSNQFTFEIPIRYEAACLNYRDWLLACSLQPSSPLSSVNTALAALLDSGRVVTSKTTYTQKTLWCSFALAIFLEDDNYFEWLITKLVLSCWSVNMEKIINDILTNDPSIIVDVGMARDKICLYLPYHLIPIKTRYQPDFLKRWIEFNLNKDMFMTAVDERGEITAQDRYKLTVGLRLTDVYTTFKYTLESSTRYTVGDSKKCHRRAKQYVSGVLAELNVTSHTRGYRIDSEYSTNYNILKSVQSPQKSIPAPVDRLFFHSPIVELSSSSTEKQWYGDGSKRSEDHVYVDDKGDTVYQYTKWYKLTYFRTSKPGYGHLWSAEDAGPVAESYTKVNDRYHSEFIRTYEDYGAIVGVTIGYYKHDKRIGSWIDYQPSNKQTYRGDYDDQDHAVGLWSVEDRHGRLVNLINY